MPLGTKVGLGPDNIVLDVDPAPPPRGTAPSPNFRTMSVVTGWIKLPLGTKVGLSPGHNMLHGDPAPPAPKKGHSPQFSACLIVAKRSPISTAAEHLCRILTDFQNSSTVRLSRYGTAITPHLKREATH